MNEEYTYGIGKYTIGIDNNGEDGIGLTVAIINDDGEIHLLGNCYGDNARCIDLLIKENQQLKEQLEEERKARKEAVEYINKHAYFDEEMPSINALGIENTKKVLDILDIDKGE